MKHFATAMGLSLLVFLSAASADEAALESLKAMSGYDDSLEGTVSAGLYMGTKRIGSMTSTLGKAPADSGAVYLEKTVMKMTFGPQSMSEERSVFMNADLSLRSETKVSSETEKDGSETLKTVTVHAEGESWIRTEVSEGKEEVKKFPLKGPNYGPCLFPVARKLAQTPGKHSLPGISWRSEAKAVTLVLEIEKAGDGEHRGKTVPGIKVTARGMTSDTLTILLTPKGHLLSLKSDSAPLQFLAGTEEECSKDLPSDTKGPAGAEGPMAAVKVYFYVLAGEVPPSDLDAVMDWKAIHAEMVKEKPEVGGITPELFAQTFKSKMKEGAPALPKAQADLLLGMLKPEIEGDTAKVTLPGKDSSFQLRKDAKGKWVIVAFPH